MHLAGQEMCQVSKEWFSTGKNIGFTNLTSKRGCLGAPHGVQGVKTLVVLPIVVLH